MIESIFSFCWSDPGSVNSCIVDVTVVPVVPKLPRGPPKLTLGAKLETDRCRDDDAGFKLSLELFDRPTYSTIPLREATAWEPDAVCPVLEAPRAESAPACRAGRQRHGNQMLSVPCSELPGQN